MVKADFNEFANDVNQFAEERENSNKAKWIRLVTSDYERFMCSNCKYDVSADIWYRIARSYCPNCGKEMVEEG